MNSKDIDDIEQDLMVLVGKALSARKQLDALTELAAISATIVNRKILELLVEKKIFTQEESTKIQHDGLKDAKESILPRPPIAKGDEFDKK